MFNVVVAQALVLGQFFMILVTEMHMFSMMIMVKKMHLFNMIMVKKMHLFKKTVEGIITEFSPDHIISNPGLRIPIDCFAPNIRDEFRRDFMAKGPTQPIGYKFPHSNDKRSLKTLVSET
jgi:hypothetical protein